MAEVRSVLYDDDGNEVEDEAVAVRGVVFEVGDDGKRREIDRWDVERKELEGDEGGLATRPEQAE